MRSLLPLGILLLLTSSTDALEKTARRWVDQEAEHFGWAGCTSSQISYYNICTGWVWAWSGWAPGERAGAYFHSTLDWGCDVSIIYFTSIFAWTGSPAGYGYTGTLAGYRGGTVDCPGNVELFKIPLRLDQGWNYVDLVNEMYVVPHHLIYTTGPAPNNPLALASDYPGQGPTGPNACGTCYPSDREVHSFYFGTESFPICPGVPFEADGCKAELLWILDGIFDYPGGPVSIESQSWGKIKSLYR